MPFHNQSSGHCHVFTLQSIKSRIETARISVKPAGFPMFLLYSPLNQGLKLAGDVPQHAVRMCFYSTVH